MEEKDLFDLFREGSESLSEQPTIDSWKRLETRLASARETKKKRRSMPLQLMVVGATVALLITAGVVNWVVAREHEARLKSQKQFENLLFLADKWSASEGNVVDELVFDTLKASRDTKILRGVKQIKFKDVRVQMDTFLLENKGKYISFSTKNQVYTLKNVGNSAFLFVAPDGSIVRLRKSSEIAFTLSFGEGQVFLYRKS
ncbi:MAG: hypothetical protein U5L45_25800 [Saprospiraceae bacterium]|nr:hypothetical protein [Saprospiraceae bacterium]